MSELSEMRCTACRGDEPTLTDAEIAQMRLQVPEWHVVQREGIKRLERLFRFRNFAQALAFANRVGEQAEKEGAARTVDQSGETVRLTWWTHKIGGLHPQRLHNGGEDGRALRRTVVSHVYIAEELLPFASSTKMTFNSSW